MDWVELSWELSNVIMFFHEMVARKLGLNPIDHRALHVIIRNGPLPAGALAAHLGMGASAVTGLVDRLERAGYVRRMSDPTDRRRVLISPTLHPTRDLDLIFTELGKEIAVFTTKYDEHEKAVIVDHLINVMTIVEAESRRLISADGR
jgi:DNA-binding MarR family transcriptional regulator